MNTTKEERIFEWITNPTIDTESEKNLAVFENFFIDFNLESFKDLSFNWIKATPFIKRRFFKLLHPDTWRSNKWIPIEYITALILKCDFQPSPLDKQKVIDLLILYLEERHGAQIFQLPY